MTELDDDREGFEPEALEEDAGDPAAAFDALRRTIETQGAQIGAEMTVMRRGLEAAFDQLEKIEPQADYKPQLAQLVQALDSVAERLHGVEQSPILRQGAQHYASALERSGESLVRTAAQQLEDADVDVTLVAMTGHHLFQPLLYQVATTLLATSDIAWPIRALMREGAEPVNRHDLSSLRILGTVGEPINPEAWTWYNDNIGKGRCPIVDTWWQTETGAHMMTPLPGVTVAKPGSAQTPLPGISLDVVDESGASVGKGEQGFLVVREPWPSMLRGIWGDRERFKETYWSRFPGMYFAGDGARYDEDGDIWLLGRVDDVMNVSGHRLSTTEIESSLVAHPSVAESAVVGAKDETTGEAVVAFVLLTEDAAAADRDVAEVKAVSMEGGNFLEVLREGALVIVSGDRSDAILATVASSLTPDFPTPSGMILTNGILPNRQLQRLYLGAAFPVFVTHDDTFTTAAKVSRVRSELSSAQPRKTAAALGTWHQRVDGDELLGRFDLPRTDVVTPLRFLHELITRARADRRRIVLPEGEDARVLRAAEILQRRDVCDLVVLGPAAAVRELASREGDRFAGLDVHRSPHDALLIGGSSLWLETRVHAEVPAGDHTVVLLEVTAFADHTDAAPPAALHRNLFHGLRAL